MCSIDYAENGANGDAMTVDNRTQHTHYRRPRKTSTIQFTPCVYAPLPHAGLIGTMKITTLAKSLPLLLLLILPTQSRASALTSTPEDHGHEVQQMVYYRPYGQFWLCFSNKTCTGGSTHSLLLGVDSPVCQCFSLPGMPMWPCNHFMRGVLREKYN